MENKRRQYTFIGLFFLWLLGVAIFGYTIIQNNSRSEATVTVRGLDIGVDLADDSQERELGLSGRPGLGDTEGMLFVYDQVQPNLAYWMKDMRFSLDIVWVSSDKKIVAIDQNVAPETYPDTFSPDAPTQFVLEVNAGFVEQHGLSVGDQLVFTL